MVSRTSFSGSTLKSTLIPVFFVKLSAVSFCRSTIWGLLTMRTRTVFALLPPPPAPHPVTAPIDAHAAAAAASASFPLLISLPLLVLKGAGAPGGPRQGPPRDSVSGSARRSAPPRGRPSSRRCGVRLGSGLRYLLI